MTLDDIVKVEDEYLQRDNPQDVNRYVFFTSQSQRDRVG